MKKKGARQQVVTPARDSRRDLIVLAADKDMEHTLGGLLNRPSDLGIRSISFEIKVHMNHDGGCRTTGVPFLRTFARQFDHGLILFDYEGCGCTDQSGSELEQTLESELGRNGWDENRAGVLVVEPELERWIWSGTRKVDRICGWKGRIPQLRNWLQSDGFEFDDTGKPLRPKEAFRAALREVRKPPSAALFRQMAQTVPLTGCRDRSFQKLLHLLRTWFPRSHSES